MISDRARRSILLKTAAKAVGRARAAWREAQGSTDEAVLRAAYRACATASRALTIASSVWEPGAQARKLADQVKRLDAAAAEFLARLAAA